MPPDGFRLLWGRGAPPLEVVRHRSTTGWSTSCGVSRADPSRSESGGPAAISSGRAHPASNPDVPDSDLTHSADSDDRVSQALLEGGPAPDPPCDDLAAVARFSSRSTPTARPGRPPWRARRRRRAAPGRRIGARGDVRGVTRSLAVGRQPRPGTLFRSRQGRCGGRNFQNKGEHACFLSFPSCWAA